MWGKRLPKDPTLPLPPPLPLCDFYHTAVQSISARTIVTKIGDIVKLPVYLTFQGWKGFLSSTLFHSSSILLLLQQLQGQRPCLPCISLLSEVTLIVTSYGNQKAQDCFPGRHMGIVMDAVVFCWAKTIPKFSLRLHVYDYCKWMFTWGAAAFNNKGFVLKAYVMTWPKWGHSGVFRKQNIPLSNEPQ